MKMWRKCSKGEVKMEKKVWEELAAIKTDIKWIKKTLGNHLKHHWAVELGLLLALIGALLKLIIK